MNESTSLPSDDLDPQRGAGGGIPPPDSNLERPLPPPIPGDTIFGAVKQYRRTLSVADIRKVVSVTGATVDDPARHKTRLSGMGEPEWASPLRGFITTAENYATSIFVYWFIYGIALMLSILLVQLWFGGNESSSTVTLLSVLSAGPFYAYFYDFSIATSGAAVAALGILMFITEPVLFFLFLFASRWPQRLKFGILTFGVALFKIVILILAKGQH